ncbi:hypothetical protein Tco_0213673 [Tanacetum coccineum]
MKLRNSAYNGVEAIDAIDHITRFLQIIDLVKNPNVDTEQLCVLTFPYSLTGEAHRWWVQEGNSKITSWEKIVDKFFYKNYPLSRASKSNDRESMTKTMNQTNENNESNQHPSFNPYQNDDEIGGKSHQKKCEDSSSNHENFDTTHSDVNERRDKGMCRVDKFEVIKYSIGDNEEFLGVRALEHQSWAQTVNGISNIYLDIFRKKDKGWSVHRTK